MDAPCIAALLAERDSLRRQVAALTDEIAPRREAERRLRARTAQLESLRVILQEITRELDLGRVLGLILRRALELVGADTGIIRLWDEAEGRLVAGCAIGLPPHRQMALGLGEGVAGAVAERREGMIVNDYRTCPLVPPQLLEITTHHALLGQPLLYHDRLIGVITINREVPDRLFTGEDRDLLGLLAIQAAIAIENARLYAELKSSYDRLKRAQDELVRAEKLRALGQMSAGIAHDLNNMLAAVLGQAELLRLRAVEPAMREALGLLITAATDGAETVRRLQDFARQQPDRPPGSCRLAGAVGEALEITRPRWQGEPQRQGRSIEVERDLPADLPPVCGSASELREALVNLILNAVDAMPEGGRLVVRGRLVSPPAAPRCVELAISDTGVGMSEEVRQRIFDPFFSTKGKHGMGLGLSVVYGIVERHRGAIEVESAEGVGTTIRLRLPLSQGRPPSAPERPAGPAPTRRILLIDDDATVRQTLAGLLRAIGHSVAEASSGPEGLQSLEREPPDCVLTDLGMPGMSGWEVAREVRRRHPALPVLLLTGWGEQPTGAAAPGEGVNRILGKPIRLGELQAAIAELTA